MWIKGLARRRSVAERVGSRRRSQNKRHPLRHRGLRIEQFEERTLLSVAPLNTNDVLINQSTVSADALAGKSVATDNNGDFVVAWSQSDAAGDSNIYARYYTDAVQRINLPTGVAHFDLQYNGNEVQKLTVSYTTTPFPAPAPVSTSITPVTTTPPVAAGTFTLAGQTIGFSEVGFNSGHFDGNPGDIVDLSNPLNPVFNDPVLNLQAALRSLGGPLADVVVQGVDADHYLINYGYDSAGQPQAPLAVSNIDFSSSVGGVFLPTVNVTEVRTPGATNDIPISNNPALTAEQNWAQTAQNIEVAYQQSVTAPSATGPVLFPPDPSVPPLGPTGTTVSVPPAITVAAHSATEFDITFTGDSSYEQQPLVAVQDIVYAATKATGAVTNAATTLNVASTTGFPLATSTDKATQFQIKVHDPLDTTGVNDEIMLVTNEGGRGSTQWTVTRAQDGTAAAAHPANATVQLYIGTTLPGGVDGATTTTTITVASATGFPVVTVPDTQFMIQVGTGAGAEDMLVTNESGPGNTLWTVVRGVNGTTATPFSPGATVTYLAPQATILKQSSDTFRVNDPEPQDPGTTSPQFYDQTNPQVAMDLDGDFVITWQSVVPDSVTQGSGTDIFAKRFSPADWVADPYRDIVFTPTGSSTMSGQFNLTTGKGLTADVTGSAKAITFDSTNLTQTSQDVEAALHALGYDPNTHVSVESNIAPYVLRVTWGGADVGSESLLDYTAVTNTTTKLPDLPATVTTESATPAVSYCEVQDIAFTPPGSATKSGQFQLSTGKGTTGATPTTLTGAVVLKTGTDTIRVASAVGFPVATADPATWFEIIVGQEVMLVTGESGTGDTTWTVKRAQDGTAAASHAANAAVQLYLNFDTANLAQTCQDVAAALHALGYDPMTTVSVLNGSSPYALRVTWGGADVGQQPLLRCVKPGTTASLANVTVQSSAPAISNRDIQFTPTGASTLSGQFELITAKGTTLTSSVLATDSTITVASTADFTADLGAPFMIQVDDEIMSVTGESGAGKTTWTVSRPQDGTAVPHAAGATVRLYKPINFNYANLSQTAADVENALHLLGFDPLTTVSVESFSAPYVLRVTWGGADAAVGQDPLLEYQAVIDPLTGQPDLAATVTLDTAVPFVADMDHDGVADTPIQGVYALGSQFRVNTNTTNPQTFPSVGMDSVGDFTITWQSEGQGMSFFNTISAQRYDHTGKPLGGEFVVNTPDDTTDSLFPYAAMSGDGLIAITWTNTGDPNWLWHAPYSASVFAKVYDAQGNALTGNLGVGGGGDSTATFDSGDNLAIAWDVIIDTDNIGPPPSVGCFAQEYDFSAAHGRSGAVIRPTFRANSASFTPTTVNPFWPGAQMAPQIVMDADGDLTVSFSGFGPDASLVDVDQEIEAQLFALANQLTPQTTLTAAASGETKLTSDIQGQTTLTTATTETTLTAATTETTLTGDTGQTTLTVDTLQTTLTGNVGASTSLTAGTVETTLTSDTLATTLAADMVQTNLTAAVQTSTTLAANTVGTTLTSDTVETTLAANTVQTTLTAAVRTSTTLAANISDATTLSADVGATWLVAPAKIGDPRLQVASATQFPASGQFMVQVGPSASDSFLVTGIDTTSTPGSIYFNLSTPLAAAYTSDTSVAAGTVRVASTTGLNVGGTIQIGNEQMTITAKNGTALTVVRGANSTDIVAHATNDQVAPATITVADPAVTFTSPFGIDVGGESMTVTAISGTTWTVTRGVGGTTIASHLTGDAVTPNTIQVASIAGLSVGSTVQVDNELMTILAVDNSTRTLTVSRAAYGTTIATHANGQTVASATIVVNDAVTAVVPFGIVVDSESMTVKGISPDGKTLTVQRGAGSTSIVSHFAGASVTGNTIQVASATGLNIGDKIQVGTEHMTITAINGNALTVTRAVDSTMQSPHKKNDAVVSATIVVNDAITAAVPFGIDVGGESMTVTAISGTTWTVTRGVGGTTIASHLTGDAVTPNTIQVASIAGLSVGSAVQVDNELMTISAVDSSTRTLTVSRAAYQTTIATHANGQTVASATIVVKDVITAGLPFGIVAGGENMTVLSIAKDGVTLTVQRGVGGTSIGAHLAGVAVTGTTIQVTNVTGLSVGDTIQIGTEQMTITAVNGNTLTVTRAVDNTTLAAHAKNDPVVSATIKVNDAITFTSAFQIEVGAEYMTVTGVSPDGKTWTVTRGVNGSKIASHLAGDQVIPDTIQVASSLGWSVGSTIQVGNEHMTVTAINANTWTVDRGLDTTAITSHSLGDLVVSDAISVTDSKTFPATNGFTVQIGGELMTVIGGAGTDTWTVIRGAYATTTTLHKSGDEVDAATLAVASTNGLTSATKLAGAVNVGDMRIQVASAGGFPASGQFYVQVGGVGGESLLVTAIDTTSTPGSVYFDLATAATKAHAFNDGVVLSTTIQVGGELMTIVDEDPIHNTVVVLRGVYSTAIAVHASGDQVASDMIAVASTAGLSVGYVIQVGSEQMEIVAISGNILTVKRGWDATKNVANPTFVASHKANDPVACDTIFVADASSFPSTYPFGIQVGNEFMTVIAAGPSPNTWTVVRGVDNTTVVNHLAGTDVLINTFQVVSVTDLLLNTYIIIDSEQMEIISIVGNTVTVQRAVNGTTAAPHSSGATVDGVISVGTATPAFPTSGSFTIIVDQEHMLVTVNPDGSWTITRGTDNTTPAVHASGAKVIMDIVGKTDALSVAINNAIAAQRATLEATDGIMRGEANGAMFSQFDASPGLQTTILSSDDVANSNRDGQNSRYLIDLDPEAVSGSFQVTVSTGGGAATATITPVYLPNGGPVDPNATVQAIYNAIEALPNVGKAWPLPPIVIPKSGPIVEILGPTVEVRLVPVSELTARAGTAWDPGAIDPATGEPYIDTSFYVYEITFIGELHDSAIGLAYTPNSNTLTRADVHDLTFTFSAPNLPQGYFTLTVAGKTTSPMFFDGTDANTVSQVAAVIANNLNATLNQSGITCTVVQVVPGTTYEFHVTFPPNLGEGLISEQPVTVSAQTIPQLSPLIAVVADKMVTVPAPIPDIAEETAGNAGTSQSDASIAMTSSGNFVEVWNETTATGVTNLYFRAFQESTDTAGPNVVNWFAPSNATIDENDQVVTSDGVKHVVVTFDEQMYDNATHTGSAVTNPLNYLLLQNGVPVAGSIVSVQYGLNIAAELAASDPTHYGDLNVSAGNMWEAVLTIDANGVLPGSPALADGSYTIMALAPNQQVLTFAATTAGNFDMTIAGVGTARNVYFDPNDPTGTAARISQALSQLVPNTTCTLISNPGAPSPVFMIAFPAAEPQIVCSASSTGGLTALPTVAAVSGLRDKAGNALARTGYVPAGLNFTRDFTVVTSKGEIDGTVFNDLNSNGVPDAGEGLAGWTVFADLPDPTHPFGDGVPDNGEISATTAADGSYKLVGLPTGVTYYIREVLPSNWNEVTPAAPADFYSIPVTNSQPITTTLDAAGNSISINFVNQYADTLPPRVTVNSQTTKDNSADAGHLLTLTGTVIDPAPSSGIYKVTVTLAGPNSTPLTMSSLASDPNNDVTLNGAVWTATVPAGTLLPDGIYTVQVEAWDNSDNSGQGSSLLTVDTLGPVVTVDAMKPSGYTNNSKPTLSGTVIDATSGVSGNVTVKVGTQTLTAVLPGNMVPGVIYAWTLDMSQPQPNGTYPQALGDGAYSVTATAMDNAFNISNPGTGAFSVDTSKPAVFVTMPPLVTNSVTPTLTGTVSDTGSGVPSTGVTVVLVDSKGNTYPVPGVTATSNTWTVTVPATLQLPDGTYDVQATATDLAGNSALDPTTGELIVDTQKPTAITVAPLLTNKTLPKLTGTVTDPPPSSGIESVTLVITDSSGASQTLVATVSNGVNGAATWTLDMSKVQPDGVTYPTALTSGTYNIALKAVDNAGNSYTSPTNALTVDLKAPSVLSITKADPDPTNAAVVHFTVTFSEAVTGVDLTDFQPVPTVPGSITGATVTGVAAADPSNTVYTVTVNTGRGDGKLRVKVVDDDSILDLAGNPLGGPGPGNGNYDDPTTYYTIDKTHLVAVLDGTTTIINGQTTPIALGSAVHNATGPSATFTIRNDGLQSFTLVTPFAQTAHFTVSDPGKTILKAAAGGITDTTNFTVTLKTDTIWAGGSETILFDAKYSDGTDITFTFLVSGAVTAIPPEITVLDGTTNIVSGQTTINVGSAVHKAVNPPSQTFTIRNDGDLPLTLTTPFASTTHFTVSQPGLTSLTAGQTTTFTVTLNTSAVWTPGGTETISFGNNDSAENPFKFLVSGAVTAIPPEITVLDGTTNIVSGQTTPIALGSAVHNAAGPSATFTIRNDGDQPLTLSTPFANTAHFTVSQPGTTSLAAGKTTTFTVTLNTSAVWAGGAETISFGNNDGAENPFTFVVSGAVTAIPPEITVLDGTTNIVSGQTTPIDLGSAVHNAAGPSATFTIQNDGDLPLTLTTPFASTTHFTVGQPGLTSLTAGQTTTFTVTLNTGAIWSGGSETISFGNNDADNGDGVENPFTFVVSGAVTAMPPEIAVLDGTTNIVSGQTTPISFGSVVHNATGPSVTFTIHNAGDQTLTLTTPFANTTHFTVGQPGLTSLTAGQTTTFTVTLNTGAIWSGGSETISFGNNDADNGDGVENPFTFVVSGAVTAMPPEITVLDGTTNIASGQTTPINVGSVVHNATGPSKTFTIRNAGDQTLTLTTPFASTAHFTVGQPGLTSLAAGQTTTFIVTLNTGTVWSGSETISFGNNDADNGDGVENPFTFVVSGTVAIMPPEITVLDGTTNITSGQTTPINFGSASQAGPGVATTFTIRNDGDQTLTLTTPFSSTAHFTVGQPGLTSLATGQTTTFTVTLNTGVAWSGSETISFGNNDADNGDGVENPFTFVVAATVTARLHDFSTPGLYDPATSTFYLKNSNATGDPDVTFGYGPADGGWIPIVGDWNGDGIDTLGLYDPTASMFYLRNTTSLQGPGDMGYADVTFAYGAPGAGWLPIAGDWNGDGKDTIGLYNPATSVFYLRNTNDAGYADMTFWYGAPAAGWLPIAGDWDGDGKDSIGLYNPATSVFYLRNTNDGGYANVAFAYGTPGAGWTPIAGDWNNDGKTTMGLFDPSRSMFFLRNTTSLQGSSDKGYADAAFAYGPAGAGWTPLAGDWNGPSQALLAAGGQVTASANTPALSQADLQPIVSEAIARWSDAGLDAATVAKLEQVQVVVADLPGAYLGKAVESQNEIYVDSNAAGYGWFVDPTPATDEEFVATPVANQLRAVDPRAVDRIDLLTVVEHELGHVAGLDDLNALADNLMSGTLGVGVRREPSGIARLN